MDKKLVGMSVLLVIVFLAFTAYVFFSGSFSVLTRASNTDNVPSEQSSLIFAWPLTIPADGASASEITVFVRNADGKGLEGRLVSLQVTAGELSSQTSPTDTDGKALFKITSTTPGVAEIDATVDNKKLLRKITVQFQ